MNTLNFQRWSAFLALDSHQKVAPNSCDILLGTKRKFCEHGRLTRPPSNNNLQVSLQLTIRTNRQLMRCISPFDNGSYHMVTIRTNRTNRQLGEGFLGIQLLRNILSPPNEMHFSIRQRVVSHGHDPYESNESTTRRRVSRHTAS